jgi:hypothetical protein
VSPVELLAAAEQAGVFLRRDGERLAYRTRSGPLSASLRELLKAHRSELLAHLQQRDGNMLLEGDALVHVVRELFTAPAAPEVRSGTPQNPPERSVERRPSRRIEEPDFGRARSPRFVGPSPFSGTRADRAPSR